MKTCLYCSECGKTNKNVYREIIDRELGPGWVCRDCYEEQLEEENGFYRELLKDIKDAAIDKDRKDILDMIGDIV